MKKLFQCFLFLAISISFTACEKEIPTQIQGIFYTTDHSSAEEQFFLFMDGIEKGVLPSLNLPFQQLTEIDPILQEQGLKLDFLSGRHFFEVKRRDGTLVTSATIEFHYFKNQVTQQVSGMNGAAGVASLEHGSPFVIWLAESPY